MKNTEEPGISKNIVTIYLWRRDKTYKHILKLLYFISLKFNYNFAKYIMYFSKNYIISNNYLQQQIDSIRNFTAASVGHISLQTRRGGEHGNGIYASFWPKDPNVTKTGQRGVIGHFQSSLNDDLVAYKGQMPEKIDLYMSIENIEKINKYYYKIRGNGQYNWSLVASVFFVSHKKRIDAQNCLDIFNCTSFVKFLLEKSNCKFINNYDLDEIYDSENSDSFYSWFLYLSPFLKFITTNPRPSVYYSMLLASSCDGIIRGWLNADFKGGSILVILNYYIIYHAYFIISLINLASEILNYNQNTIWRTVFGSCMSLFPAYVANIIINGKMLNVKLIEQGKNVFQLSQKEKILNAFSTFFKSFEQMPVSLMCAFVGILGGFLAEETGLLDTPDGLFNATAYISHLQKFGIFYRQHKKEMLRSSLREHLDNLLTYLLRLIIFLFTIHVSLMHLYGPQKSLVEHIKDYINTAFNNIYDQLTFGIIIILFITLKIYEKLNPALQIDYERIKNTDIRLFGLSYFKQDSNDKNNDKLPIRLTRNNQGSRRSVSAFNFAHGSTHINTPFWQLSSTIARETLLEESRVKLWLKDILTDEIELGHAIGKGDCFFDSIALILNQRVGEALFDVKSLRLLCDDYAKNPKNNWVAFANQKDRQNHNEYLVRIQFTAQEMEEKDKQGLNLGPAIWGRPKVEGRIFCEKYDVRLHVIEIQEHGTIISYLIDKTGKESEINPLVDYRDINILHIVNYHNHYVPLIRSNDLVKKDQQYMMQSVKHSRYN